MLVFDKSTPDDCSEHFKELNNLLTPKAHFKFDNW